MTIHTVKMGNEQAAHLNCAIKYYSGLLYTGWSESCSLTFQVECILIQRCCDFN